MAGARRAYNRRTMSAGARTGAIGFGPDSCVRGRFRPDGSKSLVQRALLAAAFARGETEIDGISEAGDVRSALDVLRALGVACERTGPSRVRVQGVPPEPGSGRTAEGEVCAGESGTLARLATAVLALSSRSGEHWTITATGSLLFRKSVPLFEALSSAGVELVRQNLPGTWPVELVSVAPPGALELSRPVSSQEVSGLALALAAHPGERVLRVRGPIPSAPYLSMTFGVLEAFGASVVEEPARDGERAFRVRGPLRAPAAPLVIEPDASSAAVALAAACLSGGELRVPGLGPGSAQGDVRIVEHLQAFGCEARFEAEGLVARGFPSRGAELELAGEPDLAPILCAVAAGAALRHEAASVLRGLATLPGKESDRLGVLATGLARLGFAVEAGTDFLAIAPGGARTARERVLLEPRGDHRMAFAFALLGCLRQDVLVREPESVAKSWGSFWSDMERLGARLIRVE
jgi:3-phosphoshikimate 1-carboxyvinyltransferase